MTTTTTTLTLAAALVALASASGCQLLFRAAKGELTPIGVEQATTNDLARMAGYVSNDLDCDDTDERVHPEADEVCDAAGGSTRTATARSTTRTPTCSTRARCRAGATPTATGTATPS